MSEANGPLDCTVAALLERHPEAIPVFMRHRMACVGCDIAAFETVEEALAIYGLDRERFADELERAIENSAADMLPAPGGE